MSATQQIQLPSFVQSRITDIAQKTGIKQEDILADYARLFNDPFVQQDPQFKGDEDRHRYTITVVWNNFINRPPVKPTDFIIVGIGTEQLTKRGKTAEIMVLCPNKQTKKYDLRRLVLQEPVVTAKKDLSQQLFAGYRVKLGEFSSGGDLVADNRSIFENPIATGLTFEKFLSIIDVSRIPSLAEAVNFPSKRGSDGYVDRTDWKIVRGLIYSDYHGLRKDGETEFGVFNVVDLSLDSKTTISEDGTIVRPGFTVWVAPELMKWARDSECDFVGPIAVDDKGVPSMTAYMVIPIHARRKEEE